MSAVVYFSSASRNTERFVEHCDFPSCGVNVFRIPLQPNAAPLNVREPYIIIVPTYGGGDARKAVPRKSSASSTTPRTASGSAG